MAMASNVTYRDLDASEALNAIISKRLTKLGRYCSDIKHSRVVLDSPHNHKHKGKQFRATVEIDLKGNPINICQDDPSIHVAVRDAFDVAERKLKSHAKQLQSRRHRQRPDLDDSFDAVAS
ncbi:30S ribosomal protein S30 [Candidatus Endobugula sertula]|uniref:30S ribosomal protein S30 n=1 Tax=Candidatus Endobugula sertula TaxID=62101 RepID=A0A1D2QSC5_9GAMM|nr:30S ribosomal protein S30 [Candidatus Endobugula sertula]